MTLQVHTARISTKDPDRFDVARKTAKEGLFLAPSWDILSPVLLARRSGTPEAEVWAFYVRAYRLEMRRSYVQHRESWDALLRRERVVLTCFCREPSQCHRSLLREHILPRLGAVDAGELVAEVGSLTLFDDGVDFGGA